MIKRKGMTLMEVLIAIFVMGIGLMAVMSLFPVGALTMARAIKDDRAGHAALNARAIAIAKNMRFDPEIAPYFNNPKAELPPASRPPDAPPFGPSFAVFVDPRGFFTFGGNGQNWLCGDDTLGVRRRKPVFTTEQISALKWSTLLDDIVFDLRGAPSFDTGPEVQRSNIVSWAWLLRRPKACVPSVCEATVVVFNQRPLVAGLAPKEILYTWDSNSPQKNILSVNVGGKPPLELSAGDWILDVTYVLGRPGNAKFHRVVSVDDVDPIFGTVELELANAIYPPQVNAGETLIRAIVVMEGVVEVFECGAGWSVGGN